MRQRGGDEGIASCHNGRDKTPTKRGGKTRDMRRSQLRPRRDVARSRTSLLTQSNTPAIEEGRECGREGVEGKKPT
ncbi:hypothetical protein NDU88_001213 [Pleurodeles waltl]|uniref:Uncharacterized protein n=1 Tax=Pleurodeles waltl TaxID=8319 RepID=A0AAV7KNZ3_PLEWA|nr:hypothetical protein NDU88_001213 [Pleurodeles waltl]